MKISELVNNKRETIQNLEKERAKLEFYNSLLSSIKNCGGSDDLDEYIIRYENLMCSATINTEINIIDAKTAKNNSEDYLKFKHIDEINIINDKIKEAMSSGKFYVTFENASFSQNTLNQLKSLGYKINYGRHYNDEYTEINWK